MRGGGIKHLRDLLARYSALTPPEGIVIDAFIQAVKEVCDIEVQKKSVTYRVGSKTIGLSFSGPQIGRAHV